MGNHYHLLIETQGATLSKGMRQLNGQYAQYFNKSHSRVGHLFQGRFRSILVERDSYLLELSRYIALNPVRAKMVHVPEQWPWSSYRGTAGMGESHECLTTDWLLSQFSPVRKQACIKYRSFVSAGTGLPGPWEHLKNQVFLGSDQFVKNALETLEVSEKLEEVPRAQTRVPKRPLSAYQAECSSLDEAMARAYLSGHYTLVEVGQFFGRGRSTISRKVKLYEQCGKWET